MKLYSMHCGFYDREMTSGIYEFHINIPVAAKTPEEAKARVRQNPIFMKKKMHIDGFQEIKVVDGFEITLTPSHFDSQTIITDHPHSDF